MFCGKCGKKIEDKVKFCPYCGTPVDQKMATRKKNTRKIVGAILVIAIIAAAALLWSQRKPKNTYEDYLAEAEQYLSELKYEQAETVLKHAIKIEPERKEAYVFLAEVYEADDKQEEAVDILKTSLKQAKLQEEDQKEIQGYIENIQNGVAMKGESDAQTKEEEKTSQKQPEDILIDYLQNTLIPDEGKIEEVAETKDFEMSENISEDEQKKLLIGDGIVASFIEDMDGDGQKELHVFRNESVNEDSNYYNRIFWEVYACEENEVKKTASQEILQYQSLYANETYNIYLKKNNGYRYIYSEADGVSMDAKMERVQSVFSYTGDKIKIEKSLVTTGGNGGFVDIYDSDSVYLPYAKRWVNGEEDKNKDAKEYYVYGDGKNYSDFDSYLEGYSSALGKALFDYGISMPIIEQTTSGQYPFFDIYLANAAKFDENLFNYQLQTDPYEYYENGKELEYTRIIKSIQVDTGKSEEDTDENATKSDEDSKKQGWRQAYIDFINSKEIQNEDYAEYMLLYIDDDDIPELLVSYGTEEYMIMHVGDSRIYSVGDSMTQLTEDHTLVARKIQMGELRPEDAERHPQRNVLTQCVGASKNLKPQVIEGKVHENVIFILCSDGFRHVLTRREMMETFLPEKMKTIEDMDCASHKMVELVKQRKETDNITVALLRCC